jgi:anaerobic selenocysteine-containing dehydrogenase
MSRRSTTGSEPRPEISSSDGDGFDRRQFCRLTALLGGCSLGALAVSRTGNAIGPGRPDFDGEDTLYRQIYPLDDPGSIVLSSCLGCHGSCPVRLATEVGVVAKCDGSPWSPRTHGGPPPTDTEQAARLRGISCARGQARLQNTHDPHRLVRPLTRVGERGGGGWKSNEPARAKAALSAIFAENSSPKITVAVDPRQQDRAAVLAEFERTLHGAEVHLGVSNPWLTTASEAMCGQPGWGILPRFERARGALIWGADAVASGIDPLGDARALEPLHRRFGEGALIVVDPRLSEVAGMADIWLPVRPGGDMALAWMILRAWMDAGIFEGPAAWAEQLAARPWRDLERRSGLGEMVVRRTADRLAEMGPGLAIRIGGGVGERQDGDDATEAVLRLAAVAGAMAPGGAMEPTPIPRALGDRPDLALRRRFDEGDPLDLLVVVGDGGIVGSPHQSTLLAALADPQQVRNLVVVSTTMNPVAALADLVVPDVTEHERQGLVERADGISLVQRVVPSVMGEVGLSTPWDRGLEGLLQILCELAGRPFDSDATLAAAITATGQESELRAHGWAPPSHDLTETPPIEPFREVAVRSPGTPVKGIALITYRESFGGFVDSTAQYWATPSLRSDNEVWMHPSTVEELGLEHNHRATLTSEGAVQVVNIKETEAIRPGVAAAALGYGHHQGFDGHTTIDGVQVQSDARRTLGFDAGSLRDDSGAVVVEPAEPEPRRTLAEIFTAKAGSCDRL